MARTIDEIIALLEADIDVSLVSGDAYDNGFADGTRNAITLIRQLGKGGSIMTFIYIVEVDYKKFTFDDKYDAIAFAETALKTADKDTKVEITIKREAPDHE